MYLSKTPVCFDKQTIRYGFGFCNFVINGQGVFVECNPDFYAALLKYVDESKIIQHPPVSVFDKKFK
jgi:hypothetical protein